MLPGGRRFKTHNGLHAAQIVRYLHNKEEIVVDKTFAQRIQQRNTSFSSALLAGTTRSPNKTSPDYRTKGVSLIDNEAKIF
jgi:hypothetical protein